MNRKDVYDVVDGERRYQDYMTQQAEWRPDMVELTMGDTLLAMQHCLDEARRAWYSGSVPHEAAMHQVRKVVGLGVQAGEQFGMPRRDYVIKGTPC